MIVGSGIDLVEIGRIQQSMDRFGKRFLDRVYTAAEQAYCLRKRKSAESFAARFAAKEAGACCAGNWRRVYFSEAAASFTRRRRGTAKGQMM